MLRRILVIILVVVVILVAIFGIRALLNRDSEVAETPADETAAVVEGEGTSEEGAVDENAAPDGADTDTETSEASVDGGQPAEAYPPTETENGAAAPADGSATAPEEGAEAAAPEEGSEPAAPEEGSEAAAPEGETGAETGDAAMGGTAESEDPNVGGGVPADNETAAEAGGETAAAPEDTGTGGVDEVAAVSPAAAFVQAGVPTEHHVENLEWLTQLARCYGTTVADIQAANNYACPDLIHPGWVVKIPNPGNAGVITINDLDCFLYHTVAQGETLYSISEQYGIHYQWLARINAIYNYDVIYAGQQLVIPNPVDPVFTQPPSQPFYYSSCWYEYCPDWQYPPVAVPYNW